MVNDLIRERVPRGHESGDRLTFFFDPICPWTWRTAQWLHEVQNDTGLQVEWTFFSLAIANMTDDLLLEPLRVLAMAREEGGNAAVERLYGAMGAELHDRGHSARDRQGMHSAIYRALEAAGFPTDMLEQAITDPRTLRIVEDDHRQATEWYGAYGSPWLVLGDMPFGFSGPIIAEPPRGRDAVEMWAHISWLLRQGTFYEMKRDRKPTGAQIAQREQEAVMR